MLDEKQKEAIRKTPSALAGSEPSEEEMLYAVQCAWNNLKYLNNPPPSVRTLALKEKGWAIQYLKEPTQEEALLAVGRDADAIQFLSNPSPEVQVAAVRTSWRALRYISDPSPEARRLAVAQSEQAIGYLKDVSEEDLRVYLKENINVLKYLHDSVEPDFLSEVLQEVFSGDPSAQYIGQFMDLEVLSMDRIAFVDRYGSKNAKMRLADYVLGR
ncbi:hypothetical protein ABB02_01661 [Clostridiaceae bacterium JG1575]|nr:hypothetical protein ABB02_01661 [Clostridiaceae bacterium JG1575]